MAKSDNKSFETSTIHNVRLDNHFTITANSTPEDPNLSWAAKGLLWYILSRPKNWTVYAWQLAKIYQGNARGGGIKAIWGLLRELRDAGYVKFTKYRNTKGQWGYRYDVYPMRMTDFQKIPVQSTEENLSDFQNISPHSSERSSADRCTAEGCDLTSTDSPSTELPNNDLPPLSPPKEASPPKKKSLRSEEEDFSIYECLKDTTLNPKDQKRLCSKYSEDEVKRALEISKTQPIKKSLMALLLNILNNPDNWPDNPKEEAMTPNQQRALRYNQNLSKVNPKLAKSNEKKMSEGNCLCIITNLGIEQISLKSQDFNKDMTNAERFIEKTKPEKGNEKP